jgi:hypothetical protein
VLGADAFERCVAAGAAMDAMQAVQYVRRQIQLARDRLTADS